MNNSSAIVQYYGFEYLIGTVSAKDIVQIDEKSKDSIFALVQLCLKKKCVRQFERYEKGVWEVFGSMNFINKKK